MPIWQIMPQYSIIKKMCNLGRRLHRLQANLVLETLVIFEFAASQKKCFCLAFVKKQKQLQDYQSYLNIFLKNLAI